MFLQTSVTITHIVVLKDVYKTFPYDWWYYSKSFSIPIYMKCS